MARQSIALLQAVLEISTGTVYQPNGRLQSVQAHLTEGTATVVIEGSNDPRAEGFAPNEAIWAELHTFTLDATEDTVNDFHTIEEPVLALRARVSAIADDGAVTVLLCDSTS